MKVGYVRVSSKQQNTNRQTDMMEELGVEKMYIEKISGKNLERPQLKEMMDFLREGDILIVESISRLARNTKDLLELTERLDAKGVKFVSKKENIDTSTPAGRFILTIFGALSELERQYTLLRQAEGIESAKRRGKHLGRPKLDFPENWEAVYRKWKKEEISAVAAFRALNLSKTRFYKLVKIFEDKEN